MNRTERILHDAIREQHILIQKTVLPPDYIPPSVKWEHDQKMHDAFEAIRFVQRESC